jgi:hypothetical protein
MDKSRRNYKLVSNKIKYHLGTTGRDDSYNKIHVLRYYRCWLWCCKNTLTLELAGVKKQFPGFTLGPLDLKIENKKILVIIGPVALVKSL